MMHVSFFFFFFFKEYILLKTYMKIVLFTTDIVWIYFFIFTIIVVMYLHNYICSFPTFLHLILHNLLETVAKPFYFLGLSVQLSVWGKKTHCSPESTRNVKVTVPNRNRAVWAANAEFHGCANTKCSHFSPTSVHLSLSTLNTHTIINQRPTKIQPTGHFHDFAALFSNIHWFRFMWNRDLYAQWAVKLSILSYRQGTQEIWDSG